MAQKAKATESPEKEAPCKLQKCSTAEFTKETEEEAPEENKAPAEGAVSEEGAPLLPAPAGAAQAVCEIPDARLIAEVQSLLVGVDLQSMTLGELRARLEGKLGLSDGALSSRKRIRRRLSFVVHQEVLKKSQRSQQCEKVVKELLRLHDYPLPARQMLIESLHHSVSADGDAALHPHQVRLLGIAQDALTDGKSKLEAAKQTIEEAMQAAEMELAAQESATSTANASAASAKRNAELTQAAVKDTEQEIADTDQELLRKRQNVKDVLQETARQQQRRGDTAAAEASLRQLAEGTWTKEEEWWECFAALQQHLLDTGAENSLLTAATVSLKKRPHERSSFDGVAVEGVGNFFKSQLTAADEQLAQQCRLEMEAEVAVLGIEALLTATRQRAQQQREAAEHASVSKESTQAAATSAQAALEAIQVATAQKQQEQVELEARLAAINEALELLAAWIAGSVLPMPAEVPEPSPQEASQEAPEEGERSPVACRKMPEGFSIKDDAVALLSDINSPLRVPTPMKGLHAREGVQD